MKARQFPAPAFGVSEVAVRRSCSRRIAALALAGAIGSLGLANPAHADNRMHTQTLYSTSFEQPKFLGGEQLLGLDGWSAQIPPFLNPMAAKITGAAARRGYQSIEVRGGALNGPADDEIKKTLAPYDAVGSYRRPLNYAVSPSKRVRVEADLLLDTNQSETRLDFFSMNIAAISPPMDPNDPEQSSQTLGEIGLSSDGFVAGYRLPILPRRRPTETFIAQTTLNRWHHVAIVLDYSSQETSYFIDGQLLGTTPFSGATSDLNTLSRASMVVYAYPDGDEETGGSGSLRSNYTARFDNFKVSVGRDASDKMLSADDDKD